MTWIILFIAFVAMFTFELWTDVQGARKGLNDNHKTDTVLRAAVLAFASWLAAPTLLLALNTFVVISLIYWIAFDLGFNLAQGKDFFYMGDGVKDSFLDSIFFDKPVLFFVLKLVLLLVTTAALFIPLASTFILFWCGFALLVAGVIASPNLRFGLLQERFAATQLIVGILGFVTAVISGEQGLADGLVVATAAIPFFSVLVASVLYNKIFKNG